MESGTRNKDRAVVSGSPDSTEVTETQMKLVNIFSYFGKIALTTAQSPVSTRVKKPNGFNEMMRAISRDGKKVEELKPEDFEKYEEEMYEIIDGQPLGGQSNLMQYLLVELSGNPSIRKLIDEAIKESINISNKSDITPVFRAEDTSKFT